LSYLYFYYVLLILGLCDNLEIFLECAVLVAHASYISNFSIQLPLLKNRVEHMALHKPVDSIGLDHILTGSLMQSSEWTEPNKGLIY
jgi:hypothetical protein